MDIKRDGGTVMGELTLRDTFAMTHNINEQTLSALYDKEMKSSTETGRPARSVLELLCDSKYQYADQMLKSRRKYFG